MKNKIKIATDLEQSKNLAEILPLESADMCYEVGEDLDGYITKTIYTPLMHTPYNDDYIPCWSLAALMDLLPSKFTEKGKYSETTYSIKIRKYALTEDVDIYQIAYGNYRWHEDESCSWSDMINTGEKENLIDAVFQMICWLKENNKL